MPETRIFTVLFARRENNKAGTHGLMRVSPAFGFFVSLWHHFGDRCVRAPRVSPAAFRSTALRSGLSRRIAFIGVARRVKTSRLPSGTKNYRGAGAVVKQKFSGSALSQFHYG